jgi:PAS domain S-box-containing protein
MSERTRMVLLITIMITTCLIVTGISISILYKTAIAEGRERLKETAQSQARLIEAVARFDVAHEISDPGSYPEGPTTATLNQIMDAHDHYKGFGKTGEFTLSKKEGDNIVFLLSHRHYDLDKPKPVPFESELAEPMRRALLDQSGTVVGLDYRGEMVLAAYEPVAELNLGIVAKIDMSEVRAPFVKAGLIGLLFTLLAVLIGTGLFIRITNPMIWQLESRTLKLEKMNDEMEQRITERTAKLMEANKQLKTEIEERKRVEEKLSEAEFQYRTVADFTYDWEYWSNLDGTLRYVSPACKRISGYESKQFVDQPSLSNEIVFPQDRDIWNQHFHDSQSELKPREIQFRIRRRDGEIRWIEHVCQPVVESQGKILGFRASNRDITKRKQLEMDAQQHREELAHLVRVATMGELSAALAHELNQPLTAILSNAQAAQRFLAGDRPDLDEAQDILADIVAEDKRAGAIIQRLRLLMKKEKVKFEFLNINEIIREATNLIYSDIVIMNVSISMDLNEVLPPVKVDRIQLQQVILNFILNASEAMKDRDPESRQLEIITRKDKSDTIIVSVRDSGRGIEKEDVEKIFEPFYTTKSGGLGMGLPINKRIIEAHDGRLWAENNPDGGMTFSFTLPIGNGGRA